MIGSNRSAENIAELLALHDQAFVHCAYLTLLGRPADPDGLHSYLRLVRQGERKISIVSQIVQSAEGRTFGADLAGLPKALTTYRRSRWPLIGRLVLLAHKSDGDSLRERSMRSIENAVHANANDILDKLDRLEAVVASRTSASVQDSNDYSLARRVGAIVSPSDARPAEGGFLPA